MIHNNHFFLFLLKILSAGQPISFCLQYLHANEPLINAVPPKNSITITMIDADGVETADTSKGLEQVIRIHYPDCKCPREIQRHFPEWVDDCVYQLPVY